jgi:hypothetical protein
VFLNQDYGRRAIGIVAAMGLLATGVIVNGGTARAPAARKVAAESEPVHSRPRTAARLETRCDPFC